ncbi:MAG: molecular chaperone DnaJ [Hyphomicrobiales bacterium]|nr:molecular chaperone DnaJ [Hyphomicrobiales bacterium]
MSKRDYYEVLGVPRDADDAALKSAFRKQAMQHHPDRNPGNKEAAVKFKELNEAYQVLSDPNTRAAYNQYGHRAFENGGGGGGPQGAEFGDFMSDIFDQFFGQGGGGRQRAQGGRERGADMRYNLEITLEDAFKGKTAAIRVPTAMTCVTCTGTGAKAGSKPKQCGTCGGYGRVRASQGFFSIERTCPTCNGRGDVIDDPCKACNGAGRVMKDRNLSVNVPAGVEDGTRIRLAGEGEGGTKGGPSGDLYIFLSVKPHHIFQREGSDLFCRVPISMTKAALGGEVEVVTLDGAKTMVKIPEGTQTAKQFRLRRKGMPVLRSSDVGDLYIQVQVETPMNLTRRQRELLAEFERESSGETHPESAGFFDRMKGFFDGFSGAGPKA